LTSRSIKNIIKDIVIVAICVAVVWIALQVYFGTPNPFYVVSSGSMYPQLAMYDIIVVTGHASFEDVRVGDIIVFDRPKDQEKVIVHRVVAVVDDDPKTLRTKGDNNQASILGTDFPITEKEYIGTVVHIIPQVGYVTKILQPPVNYIIIAIIIGIMIIKQISARQKKKEDTINNFDESKSNENIDKISNDEEYIKLKDIIKEEKKSAEKLNEGDLPEFFLDRERESEEKKE
jgi:signal peptidase